MLDISPTDDYGHYWSRRALEKQGRTAEANGHYKLASKMKPANADYAARIRDLEGERSSSASPARRRRRAARSASGSASCSASRTATTRPQPSGSRQRSRG